MSSVSWPLGKLDLENLLIIEERIESVSHSSKHRTCNYSACFGGKSSSDLPTPQVPDVCKTGADIGTT